MRIVALGGLGEFGANSLLLEDAYGERLLIDAGAAFTDLEMFGAGYELPDFPALAGTPPRAIVLTHAHDDHIKGVGLAAQAFPGMEFLGSLTTLAWARNALNGDRTKVMTSLGAGVARVVGAFTVEAVPVSHSIPGALAVRITVDGTRIVLATDLRLAASALGEETSRDALAGWAADGVDVLLLDATNALVGVEPPTERAVADTLVEFVKGARGVVVAVSFASHLGRFRQVALAAAAAGRLVIPVGRGLVESLAVQAGLGGLDLPVGLVRSARELVRLPRERLVVVATGSQGEPQSAFARLAADQLAGLHLQPGDTVLHAARVIPGNERHLADLFDHCTRRGARVVTAAEAPIHASGHPHRAELEELIALLQPRFVMPVHGRRRNLEELAELARAQGCVALVAENGDVLEWRDGALAACGERRPLGRVLLDDVGEEVLDPAILLHRRAMARDGVIVAVLSVRANDTGPMGDPELHVSGIAMDALKREHLAAALGGELRRGALVSQRDREWLRSTMTQWLRTEFRRRARRRPVVVSLVLEY